MLDSLIPHAEIIPDGGRNFMSQLVYEVKKVLEEIDQASTPEALDVIHDRMIGGNGELSMRLISAASCPVPDSIAGVKLFRDLISECQLARSKVRDAIYDRREDLR